MKKISMMVKQVLMSALTAGIFTFGFTACSDEDVMDNNQAAEMAQTMAVSQELRNLNNADYSLPFEVKADGQWRIGFGYDENGQVCYAYPRKGNGNTTVKLYVQKNESGQERYNQMYIINDLSGDTLQTLGIQQQAGAATRADDLKTSNRIYGAGYGYNIVNGNLSTAPLCMTSAAIDKGKLVAGGTMSEYNIREYTGSCFSQICNQLEAEASLKGEKGGFEGEVSASFAMKSFEESNRDYVLSKIDVVINESHFEDDIQNIAGEWLTDAAYDAINGYDATYTTASGRTRVIPTKYPSNEVGFERLVRDYGTHLVKSCKLGGRMTYASSIDLSQIEDEYSLNAFAKCGYKNSVIQGSASVADSLTAKYKRSSKAISTKLTVKGGDKEAVGRLQLEDCDKNMTEWLKSLQDGKNTMVVDLSHAELVPIYELVNDPTRAAELEKYIKGKANDDFAVEEEKGQTQDMGVIPHIKNICSMFPTDLSYSGTLVKDLYVGGTIVARVCSEFIPKFSMTERSIVIYPVCNNWAKYNMGYFIGNSSWKPQYVCWLDNGEFHNSPVPNSSVGAQNELYLSGSSFFSPDDKIIKEAKERKPVVTAENAYMTCKSWNKQDNDFVKNRPIVKIFNRIWTRSRYNESIDGWAAWYGKNEMNKISVPNWYMATTDDWNNLFNGLKNANISLPARYMSNVNGGKDLTGFSIEFNEGWCVGSEIHGETGLRMLYGTATRKADGTYTSFKIVEFDQNGVGHVSGLGFDTNYHRMFIRMVQPLKAQIETGK